MGCDIHSYAERKTDGQWHHVVGVFGSSKYPSNEPFDWRDYSVFAFLAGVRNYSDVTPIMEPRGLPEDASQSVKDEHEVWYGDAHTASWLLIEELNNFDYDQTMEDRRVARRVVNPITGGGWTDGGCTANPGEGRPMTYREFLGHGFFDDLAVLNKIGAERVVFWFDN